MVSTQFRDGGGRASRANRGAGFTLLELLVVLAVLGLVLALVPPLFTGTTAASVLKGAARELASAVRATRGEAIKANRETVFVLDVARREYVIGGRARKGSVAESLTLELVTAESERVDDSRAGIRFFPDGTSTGGRIAVSQGDREIQIGVNWLTGKVDIVD